MNLPPLPDGFCASEWGGYRTGPAIYTKEQMRAYAAEAVRVALERAAQVCEANALEQTGSEGEAYDLALSHAAAAIRALKEQA